MFQWCFGSVCDFMISFIILIVSIFRLALLFVFNFTSSATRIHTAQSLQTHFGRHGPPSTFQLPRPPPRLSTFLRCTTRC